MEILKPTVGPVVGHTTSQQCRIFLRSKKSDSQTPHFSVVRYRVRRSADWSEPVFNQLMPHNDMTAVMILDGLDDDTVYDYQAGWFSAETTLDNVALQSSGKLKWPSSNYVFKTATRDPRAERNFIIGSCRYIHTLRGSGGVGLWPDLGDQMFKVMFDKVTRKKMPIDAMFMVGDQIYADDLNLINPAAAQEDFFSRYRVAFSQDGIGKMMNNVPTYMILDDHEIEDNWPAKATPQDIELLYPAAITAYSIYQCSHSPLYDVRKSGDISGSVIPKKFWYTVTNGVSDWFVMDVRTERKLHTTPPEMIGTVQMAALLDGLKTSQARVKFVVTPVMFYPDLKSDHGDSWKSFPEQRNQILDYIRLNKIQNVIFVSGDVHCSLVSKLTHSAEPDFSVHTIVSSPLYKIPFLATYAYAHKSDFILNGPISIVDDGAYNSQFVSNVHSEDNFAYVSANEKEVQVQFFGKNGQALEKKPVVIALD